MAVALSPEPSYTLSWICDVPVRVSTTDPSVPATTWPLPVYCVANPEPLSTASSYDVKARPRADPVSVTEGHTVAPTEGVSICAITGMTEVAAIESDDSSRPDGPPANAFMAVI